MLSSCVMKINIDMRLVGSGCEYLSWQKNNERKEYNMFVTSNNACANDSLFRINQYSHNGPQSTFLTTTCTFTSPLRYENAPISQDRVYVELVQRCCFVNLWLVSMLPLLLVVAKSSNVGVRSIFYRRHVKTKLYLTLLSCWNSWDFGS